MWVAEHRVLINSVAEMLLQILTHVRNLTGASSAWFAHLRKVIEKQQRAQKRTGSYSSSFVPLLSRRLDYVAGLC